MSITARFPNVPRASYGRIQRLVVPVLLEAIHASLAVKLLIGANTLHLKAVVKATLHLSYC